MFKIVDQSGCFGRYQALTFPYGEPVPSRMLTQSERQENKVHVGCLSFNGRRRHVIIQAEYNGTSCLVSVDSRLLSRALSNLKGVQFAKLLIDNTEYFQRKVVQNVSIRMQAFGVSESFTKLAAEIIVPSKTGESFESRASSIAFSIASNHPLLSLDRWRAIGVIARDRLRNNPEFKDRVSQRSTTLETGFPRELGFSNDLIKKIADLVSNLQIGVFPAGFPHKITVQKGEEGDRVYTFIRKNSGEQAHRVLPFTLLILEQKGELPTFCFRIKKASIIKMRNGAEKKVTPLVAVKGDQVHLQSDITLRSVTSLAKRALDFQRRASHAEPSIAKVYDPPFSYERRVIAPEGHGYSFEKREFVRMDYFPQDLFGRLENMVSSDLATHSVTATPTPTVTSATASTPQLMRSFLGSTRSFFAFLRNKGLVYLDFKSENVLVDGTTIKFTDFTDTYRKKKKLSPMIGTAFLHSPEWAMTSMKLFEESTREAGVEESKQSGELSDTGEGEGVRGGVVAEGTEATLLTVKDSLMIWQFGILFTEMLSLSPPDFLKDLVNDDDRMIDYYGASEFLSKLDVSDIKIEDVFSEECISKDFGSHYKNYSFLFCLRLARECFLDESKRISLPDLIRALSLYEKMQVDPERLSQSPSRAAARAQYSQSYPALVKLRMKPLVNATRDQNTSFLDVLKRLEGKYN